MTLCDTWEAYNVYAPPYCPGKLVFPDIFLNVVTDEQKAIWVHDYNRRISKNIKDVCESLGIPAVREGCIFREGYKLCSYLCSKEKKKQLRECSQLLDF